MDMIASQITSLTIVYSTVYSDADQRKHQSPASLAFVRGIHRRPVNSPHKWPVTRKMFPFDDVIMNHMYRHVRMSSWCGNAFWVTGILYGESTDHPWIPHTKDQWCGALMLSFFVSYNKLMNKQSQWWCSETPWCLCDPIVMWLHLNMGK